MVFSIAYKKNPAESKNVSFANYPCEIMPSHAYPHKPLRKIKWPSAITRLIAHFTRDLMSDLVIASIEKHMVIHDFISNITTETMARCYETTQNSNTYPNNCITLHLPSSIGYKARDDA